MRETSQYLSGIPKHIQYHRDLERNVCMPASDFKCFQSLTADSNLIQNVDGECYSFQKLIKNIEKILGAWEDFSWDPKIFSAFKKFLAISKNLQNPRCNLNCMSPSNYFYREFWVFLRWFVVILNALQDAWIGLARRCRNHRETEREKKTIALHRWNLHQKKISKHSCDTASEMTTDYRWDLAESICVKSYAACKFATTRKTSVYLNVNKFIDKINFEMK